MARALTLALALLTACAGGGKTQPPDSMLATPTTPITTPITGLITDLEKGADGTLAALTLDVEGTSYRILVDPERDYGFDLSHLDEHLSQKLPVSVSFEQRPDGVYATAIDDA